MPWQPEIHVENGALDNSGVAVTPCCRKPYPQCRCATANVFCRTGAGGGVDPSCGREAGGGGSGGADGHTVETNTVDNYVSTFHVGGVKFVFHAGRVKDENTGAPTNEWHLSFGRASHTPGDFTTWMANDPNTSPFKVMSGVEMGVRRLLAEKNPHAISFTATKEEASKMRLWDRAGKKMADAFGYDFSAKNTRHFREYLLTRQS